MSTDDIVELLVEPEQIIEIVTEGPQGPAGGPAAIECGFESDVPLLPGMFRDIECPLNCELVACRVVGNAAGSIVVDIRKSSFANFPPLGGDSIVAAAKPALVNAEKSEDVVLTGWNKAIAAGSWLRFVIESVSGLTHATISLTGTKTI